MDFCECKFTKKPIGFGTLIILKNMTNEFKDAMNIRYMLFSVSGFEDDLKEYAEELGITLVDAKNILET